MSISYRKYRPQLFGDVLGQDAIVTTLKNALYNSRLAHAYLFCGLRGTGKTSLLRILAKALNCQNLAESEPCNQCNSCLDILNNCSLDVLEIDGASHRGIDDIRQMNETIGYAPTHGKYKIYIIDEVHMLTKEAFNALLKPLEEPPSTVKFIFATTEPHKVLPTIISRCQRFDLNRISPELIVKKLKQILENLGISSEEEALFLISELSDGSLRDAESLLDQLICFDNSCITVKNATSAFALINKSIFFKLDKAVEEYDLKVAFELSHDLFSSGKDLYYFINQLLQHYRNLIQYKLDRFPICLFGNQHSNYKASAAYYTLEQCLDVLDYLIHWQQMISKISVKQILVETILLYIIRSKYRMHSSTLVQRLIQLESKLSIPAISSSEPLDPLIKPIENITSLPSPTIQEPKPTPASLPSAHQSRYDTLLRFAAVELEAVIKKES
ncbi:DNA polymerase III [Candidatus Rhabdochlamydia oedothoracis]|uniref:DNA polymerase III subunit gamma/tau n=1 Tax=Candidatus Rhabdochlamydia oedothoracis TaxID=2720720 RepID=A0ABX8V1S4_9BACT|nr:MULTISPECIES: DNA polymerase III subunit gamma/tau [Rhabdochlamydia]KAG6559316.1 DNA polymerase III subunit tau [Candidatus Rhabdochlamydia sp. W815]MCL6755832.1 DNA polymerase III subunit gamma/tau [Candidatus Rhabdochlamydia oedothoracis]QYF49144.1 DNA polymerase III [Candidatus Rhabdochlamydia oedothoracis]